MGNWVRIRKRIAFQEANCSRWIYSQHFNQKDPKIPLSHIIRERERKPTRRYIPLYPSDGHQKVCEQSVLQRACSEGNPLPEWEWKWPTAIWNCTWRFPKNLKMQILCDPEILLLAIHPDQTIVGKDIHPNLHYSTVFKNQDREAIRMSMERWKRRYGPYIERNVTQPSKKIECHLQQPRRT